MEKLSLFKFPIEIQEHIQDVICTDDENIINVYENIFNLNRVKLPQYMKINYGYDYEDLKKIKEEINLYDIDNLINISKDDRFPKSTDNYYKHLLNKTIK